ncbi:hypothetical protein J2S98_002223 [Arthrobacter oryzae]|uniref:hypothetical protein n=1 Tax=Arthrobacter TaxID=1663 RepID=UPI001F287CFB|nr:MULTISPECIES: hypothetical protein [Arthrobacter]MDP9987064.1 hypothetical protein [Arthrobacter oryzae]UKA71563.1 hypothetical protein LFT49_02090 [Arthrobacter sp. FW306-06-A]
MMHGATFTGNLFFDPLATNLANNCGPAATQDPDPGIPSGSSRKRGVQTAEEHKALRAASLSRVSRDLERMLRDLKR